MPEELAVVPALMSTPWVKEKARTSLCTCTMSPNGGNAERVTFTGSYNISPAISPDGRWMAYVSRVGGAFRLHVMELATGTVTPITETTADESPSFAPNSRLIVYATQQQGREALMTTTLDGKIKAKLSGASGDIREPDWGPFQR